MSSHTNSLSTRERERDFGSWGLSSLDVFMLIEAALVLNFWKALRAMTRGGNRFEADVGIFPAIVGLRKLQRGDMVTVFHIFVCCQ